MESTHPQTSARKAYITPHLTVHGTVEQLTHGDGWRGSDDMFVFHVTIFGRDFTGTINYGTRSS